jgi:drug/metabolite transporter (DMT)-like permease
MNSFVIAFVSITLSVVAQFSLKAGMSSPGVKEVFQQQIGLNTLIAVLTEKYVFLGFILYGLGAIVWLGVLFKLDVSKAYPLVGLGFVFTAVIGALLGEQVTSTRVLGIVFICLGVFIVGRS